MQKETDNKKKMTVSSRGRSFLYALNGIMELFRQEPNAKLHAIATVLVIGACVIRHINSGQWIAIVLAIALVWITEGINTCIEKLCDFVGENKWHGEIKVIKDIAAGAVLIAALTSIVIGIIVFFL